MKKTLIINPFGIGDVIFSFPLVESLKSEGCQVDFLCNERTVDLIKLNPSITNSFVFNRSELRSLSKKNFIHNVLYPLKLIRKIRKEKYDSCFDLSLGKEYAFWMLLSGIKIRIGHNHKNRGRFLTEKIPFDGFKDKSVRDYHLELFKLTQKKESRLKYPDLYFDNDLCSEYQRWKEMHQIGEEEKFIVIAPGGGVTWGERARYKQWNPEYFSKLGEVLTENFNYRIVIVGSQGEKPLCQKVRDMMRAPNTVIVTDASLGVVAKIFKEASLLVGNDGGLLHLANLTQTPLIGLYGPVDERVYGPLKHTGKEAVVTKDVPCRPCYQNFHFPPCEYDRQCLDRLGVEEVLIEAKSLL